eukprot:4976932-Amphidinium_carterae.3
MDPTLPSMGNYSAVTFAVGAQLEIGLRDLWRHIAGFQDASIGSAANVAKKLGSTFQQGCRFCGVVVMTMILFLTKLKIGRDVFQILMENAMTTDQRKSSGT